MAIDVRQHSSPNFNDRRAVAGPDMLVLHYTGMESGLAALERLCDPKAEVSAHYLIEEDGTVFQLVSEQKRAWHAGIATWCGRSDINSCSIGIELVNPGHAFGYRAFPERQIDALVRLCRGVLDRHPIPARNVVGHSDVAPARKQDPGELFPWQHLAREGVGLWPPVGDRDNRIDIAQAELMLAAIGYGLEEVSATVRAFQRRFLPDHLSGELDQKTLWRIADVHQAFIGQD